MARKRTTRIYSFTGKTPEVVLEKANTVFANNPDWAVIYQNLVPDSSDLSTQWTFCFTLQKVADTEPDAIDPPAHEAQP